MPRDDVRSGVIQTPKPSEVLPDWSGRLVCWDTETSGLFVDDGKRLAVVSVAWFASQQEIEDGLADANGVVSWAFPFDQGNTAGKSLTAQLDLFNDPEEINLEEAEWHYLLLWLRQQWLTAHNTKFDLHMTKAGTRAWPGIDLSANVYWCTQVAQNVIDPTQLLALKPVADRLGLDAEEGGVRDKETAVKQWLKRNKIERGRYDLVPWDILGPYASQDAVLGLLLWAWQMRRAEENLVPLWLIKHKIEVMRELYLIEDRGMGYDVKGSRAAAAELRKRMIEIEKKLPFRSTLPAAKDWFFGDGRKGGKPGAEAGLNHLPYKVTDRGEPALDVEVLRKMRDDNLRYATEWGEWTDLENACSMWYEGYADRIGRDGRLRTSFRQTKVKSGRKSVERINLQAIPKENSRNLIEGVPSVRELFQAKEGYQLWNLDLQQAELRVAAKYARCRLMLQRLENGEDLHGETCRAIIGIEPGDRNWSMMRDVSKRLNFGGIFLIGARKFQATLSKEGIDLPIRECESIVDGWRRLYPEFGRAYRRCDMEVQSTGGIRVMLGTEYQTRHIFKKIDYTNTAWSRQVQGSLAEFLDIWLLESAALLRDRAGCEQGIVLTVHDSLVLELPEGEYGATVAQEVADLGAKRGTELFDIEMGVDVTGWLKR